MIKKYYFDKLIISKIFTNIELLKSQNFYNNEFIYK